MSELKNDKPQTYGVVSIVTPVYNSENFLPKYFEGIRAQDYPDIELILVNDGSTDGSESIMESEKKSLEGSGIKVILMKQPNSGAAAAVKAGLEVASGEFLIWPDADDILLPSSISKRVKAIVHSGCDAVVSDSYLSNDPSDYHPTGFKFIPEPSADKRVRVLSAIDRSFPVQPVGTMVRRKAIEELGIVDQFYISRAGQNLQLFIPLLYNLKWIKLNEVLQVILVHDSSHSRKNRSFSRSLSRAKEIRKIVDKTVASSISEGEDVQAFSDLNRKVFFWDVFQIILIRLGLGRSFGIFKRIFY